MATPLSRFTLDGDMLPGDVETDRFEAVEGISDPYTVVVSFTTQSESFRVEECLRHRLCLCVVDAAGNTRFYDGVVDEARFVRLVKARRQFEVRLRPALAALAHREGCRIFQEKTIIQVMQTVFQEAGFGDKVEWRNTKDYEPREFIVQYNESHLNFVSRLMEEAGLFYFFQHTAEGHQMIVGDDVTCFGAEEGAPRVAFTMSHGFDKGETLERFSRTRALRTSYVHVQDFDFEHPDAPPRATLPAEERWSMPFFEYPGGFFSGTVATRLANARMRSLRGDADVCQGESRAVNLRVGAHFQVAGAAEDCLNGIFVLTHLVSRGNQTLTGGGEQNHDTRNEFHGIPDGTPYAAPRRARRPRVRGVQTAIVTGSSKQEQALHVDKYGRVKVRFYWDRVGQQDHTASCWIRVLQPNMGASMSLPRVGWEVSVCFLEGDPDRPVILGRVYNAEKTPPYPLPATKTSGSIKTLSSPGGGGHNELVMGDSGGKQGFGVHAQKDLNVTIENDKVEQVGVDEKQHISVNSNSTVKVDETIKVGGDQSLDVGSVMRHHIGGNQSITVGGSDTSNAISNYVEKIGGNRAYTVGGTQITITNGIEQQAQGDFKRSVGSLQLIGSISSINDNVLGSLTENTGAIKVQLVNGDHGEQITGDKNQTYLAAELHLTKAGIENKAGANVTNLVGGLHYQKLDGGYAVKAPIITLLGAVGVFKGGGSELKLGGGPIVLKGGKIAVEGGLIVKMSGSMKLGC
jgi:type VI secretion system secreted protein VgrG